MHGNNDSYEIKSIQAVEKRMKHIKKNCIKWEKDKRYKRKVEVKYGFQLVKDVDSIISNFLKLRFLMKIKRDIEKNICTESQYKSIYGDNTRSLNEDIDELLIKYKFEDDE